MPQAPTASTRHPNDQPSSVRRRIVLAQVIIAGAAVMILEVLGTRIVGPVFGVGLYVWTALLTITLAMLAVGYYVGGVVADRQPYEQSLSKTLVLAASWIAVEPWLRAPVLLVAVHLGMKLGPVMAALILFGPPLMILGMAVPIAVRLLLNRVDEAGHRAGGVSALSTMGSLFGTVVGGFFLIPAFDNKLLMMGVALMLFLAGGIPLLLRHRGPILMLFALLPLGFLASRPELPPDLAVPKRLQGPYGLVEVIHDSKRAVLFLRSDHSIIGAKSTINDASAFAFTHVLEAVRFLSPKPQSILQIGLGTGALPQALAGSGIAVDVVEIDPNVDQLAREFFGHTGATVIEDARTFLNAKGRPYDVIVHDAFAAGGNPEHLLSVEALAQAKRRLNAPGVLVLNMVGFVDGHNAEAAHVVARTLKALFPHVRAFRDGEGRHGGEDLGNIIFFASESPIVFNIPLEGPFESVECGKTLMGFQSHEVLKSVPSGQIITDSDNPMARLQAPIVQAHFQAMNQLLPIEVWVR